MKIKNIGLMLGVGLIATTALAAGSESYKLKFVPKATGPITVDGKLDDAAWKNAAVLDDWGEVRSSLYGRNGCKFPKTEARLLWDERYLYLGITCWEDTPENMQSFLTLSQDRSCAIYWRDCIEFHVNGHGEAKLPKVQVWLNATDERCAIRYFDDGFGPMQDADYAQAMDWQKAYSYGDDCWRLEVKMALADLDCKGGVGARLALNLGRFRLNKKFWHVADNSPAKLGRDMQILAWTSRDRSHHDTSAGRLILVEREPKSMVEGLKISYPDLASREILVQTEGKYIVVKNGQVSEKTYLEQARELAAKAQASLDRLVKLATTEPAPKQDAKFFPRHLAGIDKPRKEMAAAQAQYAAADAAATPGALADLATKAAGWEKAFDNAYWTTLRDLVRIEGEVRHPVPLKYVEGNPAPLSVLEQCWFKPWERHYTGPVWAKPLAAKKPRVLVHVGQNDTYAAWGLKHRLDLDMDIWYSNNEDGRYHGALTSSGDYGISEAQKIQQLENLLAKNVYDGYVFIGASPTIWPARLQCALAERLVKGAKAVVINGRDWGVPMKRDTSFLRGNPAAIDMLDFPKGFAFNTFYGLDYRPWQYKFPYFVTGAIGKGRYTAYGPGTSFNFLIHNAFTPGFGNYPLDSFQDEYVRASNVRVVMEGLGLRGPATLEAVEPIKVEIGHPFALTVRGKSAAGPKATLTAVLRDGQGRVVAEGKKELKSKVEVEEWSEKLSFAGLPYGRYGVTVTLRDARGGVMDFVSNYVRVEDAGATIASLELAKPCFEKGEEIVATVVVTNPVAGLSVAAAVRDPELRTLIKGTFPVDAATGRAEIRFSDRRLTRNCHFVVAELKKDNTVISRIEREFYRHIGAETDFEVFGDASHGSTEDLRMRQAMLEWAGIDLWQSGSPTRHFYGGSPVIRSCISGKFNSWGGTVGAKWHAQRLADRYSKLAGDLKAKNGRYLSIGDDSSPSYYFAPDVPDWVTPLMDRIGTAHGRKFPPHLRTRDAVVKFVKKDLFDDDLPALKEALAEAYGDDVFWFNVQNGMNLASLDEITIAKMREVNPPISCEFANFIRFAREKYGRDLAKLNAAWHTQLKDFREISEQTLEAAKQAGHCRATLDKYEFFEYLADYQFGAIEKAVHAVYPDLHLGMGASMYMNLLPQCLKHLDTHCPYSHEALDEGRMLHPKFLGHTAGCYFPYDTLPNLSTYTIWHSVLSGANFGWFWMTFIAFRGDHAIHPGYIGWTLKAYHDLAEGPAPLLLRSKRENDGIRILYSTPSAYITTTRQADGTHGKSRDIFARMFESLGFQFDFILDSAVAAGELENSGARVLVLPCAKTLDAKMAAAVRTFVEQGGVLIADVRPATFDADGYDLPKGRLDDLFDFKRGAIEKTGVKASVKRVGKGHAIYLGCNPIAWKFLVKNGEEAIARRDFLALLRQGGVAPRYRTDTKDGTPVASVEYTRFTRDGATYLAVEKGPVTREKYPLAAFVKLDAPAWVYDVREQKALGRLEAIPVTFEGFDTKLFALLPYEVKGLTLDAPKTVVRGGTLTATASVVKKDAAAFASHLVRFDLVPKGGYTFEKTKPIRPQFVDAKDGVATASFAIAYDEADGYTLKVTDVATGATVSQPVKFSNVDYAWRGFMLDEARHFFGKEVVKQYLDRMAKMNLNVFHWHLSEDQGWRIDLPGMPELVKYGAVRPSSPTPGMNDDSDGKVYGPFYYRPEDIREILDYAAKLGIRVVPEIDFPGHMRALLAAHPEFACRPDAFPRTPWCHWGITKDVLCAGNDAALAYYERVLDEVMKIFPGEFIHIGGDECPRERWENCPKCRARMKAEGLKDANALQGWLTRRMVRYVASKGRRAIGWDEILEGGDLPKGTVIQSWRGAEGGIAAAKAGYDVIMSPYEWTYFTLAEGNRGDPYKYRTWVRGMLLPASKMRAFDPVAGIPEKYRSHILGGECCAWSEVLNDRKELEYKTLSRLSAFAKAMNEGPQDFTEARAGAIRVGNVFQSNMVLQRETPVPVFGRAVPGVVVKVKFAGRFAEARADAYGNWKAMLPPLAASKEGRQLVVGNSIVLTNVVVGDVWVLGGPLIYNETPQGGGGKKYLEQKGPCPYVRMGGTGCYESILPAPCDRNSWHPWTLATKEMLGGRTPANSTTAYVMARELFDATGVPQGIIRLDWMWDNTIDAFMPDEAYALEPELKSLCGAAARDRAKLSAWLKEVSRTGAISPSEVPLSRKSATGSAWNAMANGVAGYAVRGAVWGQHPVSLADETPEIYRAKIRALIRAWRMRWQANLPFALVVMDPKMAENPREVPCGRVIRELIKAQESVAATPDFGVTALDERLYYYNAEKVGLALAKWAEKQVLREGPMPKLVEKPVAAPKPAAEPALSVLGVFTSHMVLQRGKPIPVTGKASAGSEVTVKFADQTVTTTVDAKGNWKAILKPLAVSTEPRDLTVTAKSRATNHEPRTANHELTFTDILVGDVYLVSGQSNAELSMCQAEGWQQAFAEAEKYPNIRVAKFRKEISAVPLTGRTTNREWMRCTAETLPPLSSLGYHFAKDLNVRTGIPIGILDDNWGGRTIQAFLDCEYVTKLTDPNLPECKSGNPQQFVQHAAGAAYELDGSVASSIWFSVRGAPAYGDIHNAMIAPITDFPISGALWYQGCSNWQDSEACYAARLKALIGGWRAKWGAQLPVYIVQLQSNDRKTTDPAGGDGYANVRNAEFKIARDVPHCGLAVCADIGLSIHPGNKPDLAKRLARWARRDLYGEKELVVSGPIPRRVVREGATLRIHFDSVGSGLWAAENPSPNQVGSKPVATPEGKLKGFSIAGKDGKWAFAEAKIDGATIVLSSPDVPEPTSVRYGHRGFPWGTVNLYNREGLPAPMFALDL